MAGCFTGAFLLAQLNKVIRPIHRAGETGRAAPGIGDRGFGVGFRSHLQNLVVLAALPGQAKGMDILDVLVFQVQRAFRQRALEKALRMGKNSLVMHISAVHHNHHARVVPSDPPNPLLQRGSRTGHPNQHANIQVRNINPQLERAGGYDPIQGPLDQPFLDLPAIVIFIPGAVGQDIQLLQNAGYFAFRVGLIFAFNRRLGGSLAPAPRPWRGCLAAVVRRGFLFSSFGGSVAQQAIQYGRD